MDGVTGEELEDDIIPFRILDGLTRFGQKLFLTEWIENGRKQFMLVRYANRICPKLVIDFYEKHIVWEGDMPPEEIQVLSVVGFDQGLEPEEICGAVDSVQGRIFLMTWKNSDEANFVLATDAKLACPEIVIAYYERYAYFP